MQPQDADHQAPLPLWSPRPEEAQADPGDELEVDALRARIDELESVVADYEALLNELPELFERKFQQRLDPLMERYRLLARAQQLLGEPAPEDHHALAEIFARKTRDEWCALLAPACVTPVLELQEVLDAALHQDRQAWRGQGADQRVSPAFFSDRDFVTRPAPELGEANREFLQE